MTPKNIKAMEQLIDELKSENRWLKEELLRLRHRLGEKDEKEWAHPQSCVHNCNPWDVWKTN